MDTDYERLVTLFDTTPIGVEDIVIRAAETSVADEIRRYLEWENSCLSGLDPLKFEVKCEAHEEIRSFVEELFPVDRKMACRAIYGKKIWTSYHTLSAQEWAKAEQIGGDELKKYLDSLPDKANFIITDPKEIVAGAKISSFSFIARNPVDNEWYFTSWFVLPKKAARKTAKLMYRRRRKGDLDGYLKLIRKFKPVGATKEMFVQP